MPRRRPAVPRLLVAPLAALTIALAGVLPALAAPEPTRTLVPIGSDYQPDTLERFAEAAVSHATDGRVEIVVLPITYSTNAIETSNGERQQNLSLADNRRGMVEAACEAVRDADQTCLVTLASTLIRADAFDPANLALFTPGLDGMYVLGGDQTVAMGVVADTPLERAMQAAYLAGAALGGNSAGDAVQSADMINGYTGSNGPAESMREDAVDLWLSSGVSDPSRGLIFGTDKAIMDQHVFEYGRTGRSVNAAFSTGKPVLGMDAATAAAITDETTLTDVVGFTAGLVVDPLTYGASGVYGGPNDTLAVRRMAAHLLPPGGFGFDFDSLRPTVDGATRAAPSLAGRSYPALATVSGAGSLILSGGIAGDPAGAVGEAFVARAGGGGGRIVVLAAGYRRSTDAHADAKAIAAALQPSVVAPVRWFVIDGKTDVIAAQAAVADATGIFLTAPDPSRVMGALAAKPTITAAIRARWQTGSAALLADDAAAAAMGRWLVADPLPSDFETAASEDLLASGVSLADGLGWVGGLTITSRLLPQQRWGQVFQLVAAHSGSLGVGVDVGTGIDVRAGVGTVVGESAAVVLDGRKAAFGRGSNGALAARWVILDSFTDGQSLAP